MYLERCRALVENPPDDKWNGVVRYDEEIIRVPGRGGLFRKSKPDFTEQCRRSVQQPIPVIPLVRLVAEVRDEPAHVGHGHAEGRAGLRDHVLLDHDAAQVVRAELQGDLADLLALRHPRALDAREVVQVDARQRLRAQILVRPDRRRAQLRVLRPGTSSR